MAGNSCICADEGSALFIESVFRECRKGAGEISIFVIQYISIIIWLIALLPQVRLSYLAKISDVSILFSIIWTLADSITIVSMILTNVMMSQKIMQIYFVAVDLILLLQVLYYKKHQNIKKLSLELRSVEISTYTLIVVCVLVGIFMYYWQNMEVINLTRQQLDPLDSDLNCNSVSGRDNQKLVLAGNILGYISMPLFPLSRVVQIVQNAKTKHIEGISPLMFTLTVAGNLTQFISLIIDVVMNNNFLDQLPYMSNAILPAILDIVILIQCKIYQRMQKNQPKDSMVDQQQPQRRTRQQSVRENIMQSIDLSDYEEQIGNHKSTQTENGSIINEEKQQTPRVMQELEVATEQQNEQTVDVESQQQLDNQ